MRVYLAVARHSFRRYSTYRAATVAGAFTNAVFGFIRAFVLIALWQARPGIGGYDVTDAVTFCFRSGRCRRTAGGHRPWSCTQVPVPSW